MEIALAWRISDSIKLGTCAICVIINALHLLSTCTTPSKRRCQWWLLGTALAGIPLFTFRFAISTDLEDWRTWRIFWPPAVICVNFAGLEAVQEVAKAHFIYARNKLLVPKRLYWVYMGWGIYYVVLNIIILPIIFATNKQIFIEVLNMGEMLIILGPGMYTIYQLLTIYRFFRARVYHSRSDRQTGPISMAPTKQVASNPTVGAAQTASLLCGKPIYARDSSLSRFTRKDREMSLSYKNRGGENDVKLVVKTKETGREEGTLTTDTSPQSFNYGNRHSTGSPGSIVTSDRQSATQGSQLSNMKNPSGSPLSSTKKNPNGSPLSSTKKKNGSPLSSMKKSSIGSLLSTTQKKSLNGNVIDSTKTRDDLKGSKSTRMSRSQINVKLRHSTKRKRKDKAKIRSILRTLVLAAFVVIMAGILLGLHISNNIKSNKKVSERNVEVYSKYQIRNDMGFAALILILVYLEYHSHVRVDLIKLSSLRSNRLWT